MTATEKSNTFNPRLTKWALDNAPTDQMLWKEAFWDQIDMIRGKVARTLSRTYEEYKDLVDVVGSHTSKSIKCPVYFIDLPQEKVKIWMRYNFHDWNVSVEADMPIICNFLGVFDAEDTSYCYCQGMEDKLFESYSSNQRKFTVCIKDHYDLYVFFRVLGNHLGIKQG